MSSTALYETLQTNRFLIAGPCVIESEELVTEVAEHLQALQEITGFKLIFKASFDKANRTSLNSFRGGGIEWGLDILAKVGQRFGLPVLTDIHESGQAALAAQYVDVIQIPAFLCRQTDLLLAAGATGKVINVKKAQFLSAADMQYPLQKLESTGNRNLLLTERGTMFGYNNLVVDYTGILEMMRFGYPVIMDATHSVQKPNGANGQSAGNREFAPYLAQAAAAIGVKGFFIETHPNPPQALSDGANMIYLKDMQKVLEKLKQICEICK